MVMPIAVLCRALGRRSSVALACAVMVLGTAVPAIADDDDYGSPSAITPNLLYEGDTTGLTTQTGEPLTGGAPPTRCGASSAAIGATRWLTFTGSGGPVTVTTEGSAFDTVLGLYLGSPPSASTFVTCNDDVSAASVDSRLTFRSSVNHSYMLQLGGTNGTAFQGAYLLAALTNDTRAYAEEVPVNQPLTRTYAGATSDAGEVLACQGVPFGRTVWFGVAVPAAGRVVVTSDFTTAVAVYRDGDPAPLACAAGDVTSAAAPSAGADVKPGRYVVQLGLLAGASQNPANFGLRVQYAEYSDLDGDGDSNTKDCAPENKNVNSRATEDVRNDLDDNCDGIKEYNGDGDPSRLLVRVDNGQKSGDCNDRNRLQYPGTGRLSLATTWTRIVTSVRSGITAWGPRSTPSTTARPAASGSRRSSSCASRRARWCVSRAVTMPAESRRTARGDRVRSG